MRRVLMVCYYFPPSGGAGVQRMLKFVKFLRGFGWEPVVLTVEEGAFPQRDPSLLADIPAGVEVLRTDSWDPFTLYAKAKGTSKQDAVKAGSLGETVGWTERLAVWARANLFLPDARVGWVPYARKAGLARIRQGGIDAVVTSGPPHSVHLVGQWLHRKTGVPWLADFRDPWTGINFYDELPMTGVARWWDARLERSVLREANRVVTVSPLWGTLLAEKAGLSAARIGVIQNGFDHEDFAGPPPALSTERFTLGYVGSMYGLRNPPVLWQALADLRADGSTPQLRLHIVGNVDAGVRQAIAAKGLEAMVTFEPYVPHAEAVAAMRSATALLLVIDPYTNERGNLTGKVYEYLGTGRPIVGLGPAAGDPVDLLATTGAGRMIERTDLEGLKAFLRTLYAAWASGAPMRGATSAAAASYTRQALTGALAQELDALLAHRA